MSAERWAVRAGRIYAECWYVKCSRRVDGELFETSRTPGGGGGGAILTSSTAKARLQIMSHTPYQVPHAEWIRQMHELYRERGDVRTPVACSTPTCASCLQEVQRQPSALPLFGRLQRLH